MSTAWGRFTARGSQAVEERIAELVASVATAADKALKPEEYVALILLGGFGRGEGGVVVVNGEERPHNNLDFLLIARANAPAALEDLRRRLNETLLPISRQHDVELDVSVIADRKLRRSAPLVMWYDMRNGHKTLLGDKDYVPSLTQFRLDRIRAWDVRNLLVNRGTLLIINDHMLASGPVTETTRRIVIKHVMKAIIGYGDALLYFLGDYDWSYQEKQRRMKNHPGVPANFKALYDEAIEFRFVPAYETYLERDPVAWMGDLREALAVIHLECESHRLRRPGITWSQYPSEAFAAVLRQDIGSPRAWAKKVVSYGRTAPCRARILGRAAAMGCRAAGPAGQLPILFPVVGYDLDNAGYRDLAAGLLEAHDTETHELRRAYLMRWGAVGDSNFASLLRKWNLTLEPAEATP